MIKVQRKPYPILQHLQKKKFSIKKVNLKLFDMMHQVLQYVKNMKLSTIITAKFTIKRVGQQIFLKA